MSFLAAGERHLQLLEPVSFARNALRLGYVARSSITRAGAAAGRFKLGVDQPGYGGRVTVKTAPRLLPS
jgi:hypothetical protein